MAEKVTAIVQHEVFILTIHDHGLGIMGVYDSKEDAQEAALRDCLAREMEHASDEHGEGSPEATNVEVNLAWDEHRRPDDGAVSYRAEFDRGAMSHYYEVLPRTVGEDVDGY